MYSEKELVVLAKRENNQKRKYLVVNRLQGKHIPVSPKVALAMFDKLAEILLQAYGKEKLLLIGFAETATAIGAAVAGKIDAYYIQTTREELEGAEYFYFSEVHSHATEQKLVRTDIEQVIQKVERIVFIEDEITTGNTILNIIRLLRKAYGENLAFSAASILNGMGEEHLEGYKEQGILLHYLTKIDHGNYEKALEGYQEDGICRLCDGEALEEHIEEYQVDGYQDARRLVQGKKYQMACQKLCEKTLACLPFWKGKKVLVLGTEEFMYPALCVAERLEEMGNQVSYHATTRSPISVSMGNGYPFSYRYELISLYNHTRKTFLYNIGSYEEVLVVTDAQDGKEGLCTLIHALRLSGNKNICLIRWC